MHRLILAFVGAITAMGCTSVQPLMVPVPRYPEMLRSAAVMADVPVRVTVGRTGTVTATQVDTQPINRAGAHPLFAMAIKRAMREALFAPARQFGVAKGGHADFVFRFALTRTDEPMRPDEVPGKADSLPVSCPPASSTRVIVACVSGRASRGRVVY